MYFLGDGATVEVDDSSESQKRPRFAVAKLRRYNRPLFSTWRGDGTRGGSTGGRDSTGGTGCPGSVRGTDGAGSARGTDNAGITRGAGSPPSLGVAGADPLA